MAEVKTDDVNPLYAPLRDELLSGSYGGLDDKAVAAAINAKAVPAKPPAPTVPNPTWASVTMGLPYVTEFDVAAARKMK